MSPRGGRLVRLGRWLLSRVATSERNRQGILGDLDELYNDRRDAGGGFTADVWYLKEAAVAAVRLRASRSRERRTRTRDHAGTAGWSPGLAQDLVHAIRGLTKAPSFSLVCLLSLAGGLGVSVALLMFFRATFSPPPVIESNGLVELLVTSPGRLLDTWSYPDFMDVGDATPTLDITGWAPGEGTLRTSDDEIGERLSTIYVSTNYFGTLGFAPAQGRGFASADDVAAGAVPIVVAHGLWQNRLGGDPLGRLPCEAR